MVERPPHSRSQHQGQSNQQKNDGKAESGIPLLFVLLKNFRSRRRSGSGGGDTTGAKISSSTESSVTRRCEISASRFSSSGLSAARISSASRFKLRTSLSLKPCGSAEKASSKPMVPWADAMGTATIERVPEATADLNIHPRIVLRIIAAHDSAGTHAGAGKS